MMALIGTCDVVATQFLGRPIPGAHEITEMLMVSSLFFGIALAQAERRHVRVSVLVDRLPARTRLLLQLLADLSIAVLFALIAWFGWLSFLRAVNTGEFAQGLARIPLWPSRLALVIGASLLVLQALAMVAVRMSDARGRG